ncbi:MAG: VTT domain-containing protein [Deltaproteobacteria bacterium]|nr:VTT domain-containing protein [Deltaproteobacteria bacterium]
MPYSFGKQLRTVVLIELLILANLVAIVAKFWSAYCGGEVCLIPEEISRLEFFFLSVVRPFLFTPIDFFAVLAGSLFGSLGGTVLTALSGLFTCAGLYWLARLIGRRFITPWLGTNLPQTLRFIRSQDWKVIVATRLIPFFPYDILSFIYGLANFRWYYVLLFSFLASLPELYIFSEFGSPTATFTGAMFKTVTVVALFFLTPGLLIEYLSRQKGSSMWMRLKAMWMEIVFEIRLTNTIIRERVHDPSKTPVFVVYGFFSSRKTLTVLGRFLEKRGYEVITFNLGGLFGVFSTQSVTETAELIDRKLTRYIQTHNIDRLSIVAHSKGGLVALWWLLKMGGHKYCDTLITMGTPFEGTYLTWLGLLTPLGPVWKDVWQMKPGSDFLKELKKLEIPPHLQIYNIFSDLDYVARGQNGIFKPVKNKERVHPIPMHHVEHIDFLKRRDVGDTLAYLLGPASLADRKVPEKLTDKSTKKERAGSPSFLASFKTGDSKVPKPTK